MRKKIIKKKQSMPGNARLFTELKELILSARKAVVRNVNTIQVITNFEIGRHIVEHEQKGREKAEYGEKLLKFFPILGVKPRILSNKNDTTFLIV